MWERPSADPGRSPKLCPHLEPAAQLIEVHIYTEGSAENFPGACAKRSSATMDPKQNQTEGEMRKVLLGCCLTARFSASLFSSIRDLDRNCTPHPTQKCSATLNSIGHQFERDQSGRGRLFAPSIALILGLAQTSNQQIDPDWKVLYKEAVGADWPSPPPRRVPGMKKTS